jgi:hypothetical protein
MHEREVKKHTVFSKERDHAEDLGVDGKILLSWTLGK